MALESGDNILRFVSRLDNDKLKKDTDKTKGILGNLASSVSKADIFAGLGIGAAMAFKQIATKSYELSTNFEQAMRSVESISKATQEDFEGMGKAILDVGLQVPQTAEQMAKAFYSIASAGYDGAAGLELLDVSAKAAVAGMTDTETAADALTTVLNAWKLSTSEAESVSDKLFQTLKGGKTTFPELARNMADVAPLAATLGVKVDEVLGGIAALTKQGTPTSEAFTQIKAALAGTTKALGDGWSETMTMQEAFVELQKQSGGSITKLQKMIGSIEAVNAVLGMTGQNAEEAANLLNSMGESSGAAGDAFATMIQSQKNQVELLQANIQGYLIEFGDFLRNNSNEVVKYINAVFEGRDFQPLLDAIMSIYEAYETLGGGIFELLDTVGILDKDTGDLTGIFKILGFTVELATLPIRTIFNVLGEGISIISDVLKSSESFQRAVGNLGNEFQEYNKLIAQSKGSQEELQKLLKDSSDEVKTFADRVKKAENSFKMGAKYMEEEATNVNKLAKELADANTSTERRKEILDELAIINPKIVEGLDAESLSLQKLSENLKEYNDIAVKSIVLDKKRAEIANLVLRQNDVQSELNELMDEAVKILDDYSGEFVTIYDEVYKGFGTFLKQRDAAAGLEQQIKSITFALRDQVKQRGTIAFMMGEEADKVKNITSRFEELQKLTKDINAEKEESLNIDADILALRQKIGAPVEAGSVQVPDQQFKGIPYLEQLRKDLAQANEDLIKLSAKPSEINKEAVKNQNNAIKSLEKQIEQQEFLLGLKVAERGAEQGSIAFLENKISLLNESFRLSADNSEREKIKAETALYQAQLDAILQNTTAQQGSIAYLEEKLRIAREEFELTNSQTEREKYAVQIIDLEAQIKLLRGILDTEKEITDETEKQRVAQAGSIEFLNKKLSIARENFAFATSDAERFRYELESRELEHQISLLQDKNKSVIENYKVRKKLQDLVDSEVVSAAQLLKIQLKIKDLTEQINESVSYYANEVAAGLNAIGDAMNNASEGSGDLFNSLSSVASLTANIASGNYTAAIGSLSQIIDDINTKLEEKRQAHLIVQNERLTALYESQSRELTKQLNLLKEIKGIEIYEGYDQTFQEISGQVKELENQLSDGLEVSVKQTLTDKTLFGENVYENYSKLSVKSIEEIEDALNDIPQTLGDEENKIDFSVENEEELRQFLEEYDELIAKQAELRAELYATLTQTTGGAITDSILDGFANGKLAAEDFAGTFEDLMRNSILESFKIQFLESQFQNFYDAFGEAAVSGDELTQNEIQDLQNKFNANIETAQAGFEQFDQLFKDTFGSGLADATGAEQQTQGLAGEIKASLTESTGQVLSGTLNSMKLTMVGMAEAQQNMVTHLASIDQKSDNLELLQDIRDLLNEQNNIRSAGTF